MNPQHTVILIAGALLLASCGAGDPLYPGPSALETGHWVKVRANPPTYFPKGLPRAHPTNARDGYWVVPGDQADSRFFVPVRGRGDLTRDQLMSEAWALTPPERQEEIARENRRERFVEGFWQALGSLNGP